MNFNYLSVGLMLVAAAVGGQGSARRSREVKILSKTTANEDHQIKRDNVTEMTIAGDPKEIQAIFSFLSASVKNQKNSYPGKWRVRKRPKTYDVVTIEMSWHEALIYCKERRGNLATILSQDEMDRITVPAKLVANSSSAPWYYWIGGTRLGSSGGYYWFSDGQTFSFSDWVDGYPTSDAGARCMQLYYGGQEWGWINVDCSIKRYPICEYGFLIDNLVLSQENGLTDLITHKPKTYEVITIEMSWFEALIYCKERRGNLATILSQGDMDRIAAPAKLVANSSSDPWYYWIGGTKLGSFRGYYWFSDGQTFSYYNWRDGYPTSDDGADCMQLNHQNKKWGWINLDCRGRRYPICEYGPYLALDVDGDRHL